LLFFAESPGTLLPTVPVEHTIFAVDCAAELSLNLNVPPLNQYSNLWRHPVNYGPCQDLATKRGSPAFRRSDIARCVTRRVARIAHCSPLVPLRTQILEACKLGMFSPALIQCVCVREPLSVCVWCESPRVAYEFVPDDFSNDPRLMPIRQPPPTPLRHRGQPPDTDGAPGASGGRHRRRGHKRATCDFIIAYQGAPGVSKPAFNSAATPAGIPNAPATPCDTLRVRYLRGSTTSPTAGLTLARL